MPEKRKNRYYFTKNTRKFERVFLIEKSEKDSILSAMLTITHQNKKGRRGVLSTNHGVIQTPFFMPVGTAGAMKGITLEDLEMLGAEILLSNTYHLHLSPGETIVERAGGLHQFIHWNKPILTDSGGFQVFSLKQMRVMKEDGVEFSDHRSGQKRFLGPKEAMAIQHALGSDIIMCFDECPPSTAPRNDQIAAVDRTLRWAKVCKEEHLRLSEKKKNPPLLFGIVQGGLEKDLRKKCAEELMTIGFDGYAVGGLAVGESEEEMYDVLDVVCPLLPSEKPRYLMGVGERHQITHAVAKGIDMFDCVSPMREARHGNVWLSNGEKLRIRRSENKEDFSPIDTSSPVQTSVTHSKAYLHHLMRIGERYGETLACLQNIGIILEHMKKLRGEIEKDH